MRKRGFTYFELVGVVALLTVIMAISLVSIRTPGAKREADSAGKVLLSALQAARAQALAKDVPVAVALAVEDEEAATGFYVLEGHLTPRVVSATDLSSEFPGVYVTNVAWADPTTSTVDPGENFLIDAWLPPREDDPAIIFLPSGKVVSNGLELQDNHYTLVLGRGLELTAGSTPTRILNGVSDPYTIRVGEHGEMTLSKGLPGGEELILASAEAPSVGTLPPLTPPDERPPEVLKVAVFPEDPEGVSSVPLDGTMSLQVEAWSPSGEPLFALWTGDGSFSSDEPIPMEWRPVEGVWRGRVEWASPAGSSAGDTPEFDVQILSANGQGSGRTSGNQSGQFTVAPSSRKVIYSVEVPANIQDPTVCCSYETQLRQVYDDGSGDKILANSGGTNIRYSGFDAIDWSPDGSRYLVYHWQEDIDYTDYHESFKLGLRDTGPVEEFMTSPDGDWIWAPKWSPDGTKVTFEKGNTVWMVDADGQNARELKPEDTNTCVHATSDWSTDGRYLVYEQHTHDTTDEWWQRYEVEVHDTQTGTNTRVDGIHAGSGAFLPGTSTLVVTGYDDAGNAGLYESSIDGTTKTKLVDLGTNMNGWWTDMPVGVSPDGRYVSFHAWPDTEPYGMRVFDRDTGALHVIEDVEPLWGQTQGQWAPDGEPWILAAKYYSGADGSGTRLIRCRPDGSEMTWVTDLPEGYDYSYIYSADWTK